MNFSLEINFLLHKKFRLPSYLIPEVVKKGKRFHSPLFTLIVNQQLAIDNQQSFSRFAFIVPKKFDKRAVRRGQLKRWMREVARAKGTKIKKGYNIILIARQPEGINNIFQIKIEMEEVLNKAGFLK